MAFLTKYADAFPSARPRLAIYRGILAVLAGATLRCDPSVAAEMGGVLTMNVADDDDYA